MLRPDFKSEPPAADASEALQGRMVRLALNYYAATYMLACCSDACEEGERILSDEERRELREFAERGKNLLMRLPFELEFLGFEVSVNHEEMRAAAVGIARARMLRDFEQAELLEKAAVEEAAHRQPQVCVLVGDFRPRDAARQSETALAA